MAGSTSQGGIEPMLTTLRYHLSTLKGRLVLGAAAMLSLIGAATWIGYATVETVSQVIAERLDAVRISTAIGTELETLILRQIAAAEDYLANGDSESAALFASLGRMAHHTTGEFKQLADLTTPEQAQIVAVEELHARMEVDFALAHALRDLGRTDEAETHVDSASLVIRNVQAAIRNIGAEQTEKMAAASAELGKLGRDRQRILLAVLTLALGLGGWGMFAAIRGIDIPLKQLMSAARRLGKGDLRVQLDENKLLREFAALGAAFNTMAAQLRTLVQETAAIAEQVSTSAFDLSSISEEVAASSGEVATAMVEITGGAESQSHGLRSTLCALEAMGKRTQGIALASGEVSTLSDQIDAVACDSGEQVAQALTMLLEIRGVVQASEGEVRDLERASSQIDRFVETISGIARQTNLLALNAAIEAARAGEHGRGFAVVAEEVRKLADGSAGAAREVAQVVEDIRSQVTRMVGTMERGSHRVAGVEEVSKAAGDSLSDIRRSIEDIRRAAGRVAETVASNQDALQQVEEGLAGVSGTAEAHAASAQQVAAAAEEQSAATEELSGASQELLLAAERMKQLISGLKA
jgi:methyl-accepting chemotaxis protein